MGAITANLPGAVWQRCRTHYAANLVSVTPKHAWPAAKAMLHSVYHQPDAASVHAQFDRLLDYVAEKLPDVSAHLNAARDRLLAFTTFPKDPWTQICPTTPPRDSTKRSAAAPTPSASSLGRYAIIRLVGAVLAGQTDEWVETKRYSGLEALTRCRLNTVPATSIEEVTETLALTA